MSTTRRIIIVDDDVDHLLVSKLILERRGYDVLTLVDCEELVDRIKVFKPGLIFMDHNMPAMTGMEATRMIKSGTTSEATAWSVGSTYARGSRRP